jgi:plasmid stabilization system protein ParE
MVQILLAANLLALIAVLGWLFLLQRRTAALQLDAQGLAAEVEAMPADLRAQAGAAGIAATQFYTIEILNPLEVAAADSKLGEVFGSLTPAIVRREVHRRAHGIIRRQLAERGIRADVRLHG